MRPRVLRRRLLLMFLGALLAGAATGTGIARAEAAMSEAQFCGYLVFETIALGVLFGALVVGVLWVVDRLTDRWLRR